MTKMKFCDILEGITETVEVDEAGWATFFCPEGGVAVWVAASDASPLELTG